MEEAIYAKELSDKAESISQKYAVGQLLVAGDNRYLSDDLMRLFVDWFAEDNPWVLVNGFLMMFVKIEDANLIIL